MNSTMDTIIPLIRIIEKSPYAPLTASVILSIAAHLITYYGILFTKEVFVKSGRAGKDLLKKDRPVTPESLGVIVGVAYFVCLFVFIPVPFFSWLWQQDENSTAAFPHDKFAHFLGGLLSLFSMLFLGFADDVLDIRWRVKIWFPFIASLPVLMVYHVTYGQTDALVPIFLRDWIGARVIPLGYFYYAYMSCLAVFSTNAINIMAGANGVEGGQSLVIALSLLLNDILQLVYNKSRTHAHLSSMYFLLPYVGATLGYLRFNWYPAQVFGGDTFAYFSGMIFAVVGITSNLSKTVLLFMIPQIFNFLYSCPQLFGFVECPRHRMPRYNEKLDKVETSRFTIKNKSSFLGRLMMRFLELFGLAHVTRDPVSHEMLDCPNLTIFNLILSKTGPISEERLVVYVMLVQVLCSAFGFFVRYGLVHIVYNKEE